MKAGVDSISFQDSFDFYLNACTSRSALVTELKKLLLPFKGKAILDCSVGTGFAMLDLIRDGLPIVCADGSAEMLSRFSENAASMRLHVRPIQARWDELGSLFGSVFDLVICRGNSLIYADMWDADHAAESRQNILKSLENMRACLKPCGVLYVDIPAETEDPCVNILRVTHPLKNVLGSEVNVSETVEIVPGSRFRKWDVAIRVGGRQGSFTRYSHLLNRGELTSYLRQAGFADVAEIKLEAGRAHYQIYSATNTPTLESLHD